MINEIEKYLTRNNHNIDDYVVIIGDNDTHGDGLFLICDKILYSNIIENDLLYIDCIEYIKSHNRHVYDSMTDFKNKNPNVIC